MNGSGYYPEMAAARETAIVGGSSPRRKTLPKQKKCTVIEEAAVAAETSAADQKMETTFDAIYQIESTHIDAAEAAVARATEAVLRSNGNIAAAASGGGAQGVYPFDDYPDPPPDLLYHHPHARHHQRLRPPAPPAPPPRRAPSGESATSEESASTAPCLPPPSVAKATATRRDSATGRMPHLRRASNAGLRSHRRGSLTHWMNATSAATAVAASNKKKSNGSRMYGVVSKAMKKASSASNVTDDRSSSESLLPLRNRGASPAPSVATSTATLPAAPVAATDDAMRPLCAGHPRRSSAAAVTVTDAFDKPKSPVDMLGFADLLEIEKGKGFQVSLVQK